MVNLESTSFLGEMIGEASARGLWPTPQSRDFAELSDPLLFAEVLEVTQKEGRVSLERLTSESEGLRKTLRGLWVVEKPTKTTIGGLLSAMKSFGWIEEIRPSYFGLTNDGVDTFRVSRRDEKLFRRLLAAKMHRRYVIPGWIVSRLLALNPSGQGEIVLPSPPKDWQPQQLAWENHEWNEELESQARKAAETANRVFPGSFPVDVERWIDQVSDSWEKLGNQARRKVSKRRKTEDAPIDKPDVSTYAPRGRLSQAMRESSVDLMFSAWVPVPEFSTPRSTPRSQLNLQILEFSSGKHPIPARAFRAWCPRLDALELVFYTDWHPLISGRLIFPCGGFKTNADTPPFEIVPGISDPSGRPFYLHQPTWEYIDDEFLGVLLETYSRLSKRIGALYLSLLDVRDEVCRQLRLSSIIFDRLIETAYDEIIRENVSFKEIVSISLESDIRPEQRTAQGMLRRPVYVKGVPHSLIAISRRRRL